MEASASDGFISMLLPPHLQHLYLEIVLVVSTQKLVEELVLILLTIFFSLLGSGSYCNFKN